MMKPQELMMNDWVMKTDVDGNPVAPYQIDWIRTGEVGLLWNVITTPPLITPIPLTAEILEKNGIKFQYGKVWYQLHSDRMQLAWEHNGDTIRLCVDYVHQLQHALRLCGLTELADNFQVI